MKKDQRLIIAFFLSACCLLPAVPSYAQNEIISVIKFKNADIKVVLQSIAQKAVKDGEKVNIIVGPQVEGSVNIDLENVDWFTALAAVLKSYDYDYQWIGRNIILVDLPEKIKEREAQEKERQEVEPPRTRVFNLKYIDAADAKKTIEPILSPVGRASILEMTGQAGWEFGTDLSKRPRSETAKTARTKTLVVSDISKKLDEITALISEIDVMPKQVLIKAKIMEVNRDFLKDIGFDWGTGITGATSGSLEFTSGAGKSGAISLNEMAAKSIIPTPAGFGAKSSGLTDTPKSLQLAYRKLAGTQFEVLLYALEEDGRTKTLSEPVILTLDNQEASILVGTKIPILKTDISTENSQVTGGSLDYYQDIGIQLNVVPQISGENHEFINLIIHPAVTSTTSNKTLGSATGNFTIASYPIIISREIETQAMIKDGETIVIGGLFKDVRTKYVIGFPLLKDLPFVGKFFRRDTYDDEKIDLMIFLTAKIVEPGELLAQQFMATDDFNSEFKKGYK